MTRLPAAAVGVATAAQLAMPTSLLSALSPLSFLACDAAVAVLLYQLFRTHPRLRGGASTAALAFFANPYTVLSSCGVSTAPFARAAVVAAVFAAAVAKSRWATAAAFAVAAHLRPPYLFLAPAVAVLLTRPMCNDGEGGAPVAASVTVTPTWDAVSSDAVNAANVQRYVPAAPAPVAPLARQQCSWHVTVATGVLLAAAAVAAACVTWAPTVGVAFTTRPLVAHLLESDLQPNVGVAWYFFAEVLAPFRDYFRAVWGLHPGFYLLPYVVRFHREPLVLWTVSFATGTLGAWAWRGVGSLLTSRKAWQMTVLKWLGARS